MAPPPTFLSRLLVPVEWRAFRKPAVVDQRVGFFLEGGSSVWTRDSPPLNGPLMLSKAGSLLRRTWSGISEGKDATESLSGTSEEFYLPSMDCAQEVERWSKV